MKPSAVLIGVVAGAASALLFAGLVLQSSGAIGLAFLAPVPIFLASLGWGSLAGGLAAAAAFVATAAFTGSFLAGLSLLLPGALPAAVIGHLAGLARPVEHGTPGGNGAPVLDWYPVSRILFAITLAGAGACLAIGWLIGFDPETLTRDVAEALGAQAGAADQLGADQVQRWAEIIVSAIPFVQPAFLVAVLVGCLYVSAAIARASGRMPRPRDDIPSQTGLPKVALAIFAAALALSFLQGPLAIAAAVVVGAFALSFTFVGLAAMHRRTRGRGGRGLILFTAYAGILLLSFPLIAFLVLGLFDTARSPVRPAPNA